MKCSPLIELINARTLSSVINSFFGTSQLSQFLDQVNPLAEITLKINAVSQLSDLVV